MSIIALTTYNDMAGSPTPSSGILLGLDIDGVLKQKDQNGNITVVGSGGGTSGTSGTSGISGTSGSSGTSGANGYDGANTFRWTYGDESTATEFRLSDINFPIDNIIYLNTTSKSGDTSSWLNTLVDHVTTNPEYAYLHLVEVGTPNSYAIYKVLSGSASGVYYNFSLSYVNGDGIAATGSEYTVGWSLFGKGNLNYAGVTSEPSYNDNGDGTITIGTGVYKLYHTADFTGDIYNYVVTGGTFSPNIGVFSYIYVDYNSGSPELKLTEDQEDIQLSDGVILYSLLVEPEGIRVLNWDNYSNGLGERLHNRFIKTNRFSRESGFELSEYCSTPGKGPSYFRFVKINEGIIWYGAVRDVIPEFNSDADYFRHIYWSGTTWSATVSNGQYNNTQYNDSTGLVELDEGRWTVNWIYRTPTATQSTAQMSAGYVLGNSSYGSLAEADDSQPPTIPDYVSKFSFLVGRIIVQKNADVGTVQSAFDIEFNPRLSNYSNLSTGLIQFGGLTKNTSATPSTTFDVGAIKGWIVDNTINPESPTITYIDYIGAIGLTLSYMDTHPVTYIGIDRSSSIIQSISSFTASVTRDIIPLGVVVHSDNVSVVTTNNQPIIESDNTLQLYDLFKGLGKFNVLDYSTENESNIFVTASTDLTVKKTFGYMFSAGSNYINDPKNPHIKEMPELDPVTFRYRLQNSTEYANTTNVDPDNYDLNGVLTTVPDNKFTIQRCCIFESNLARFQYGQNLYDSIDDAEASIPSESFVTEPNIAENGLLRTFLIVRKGTTDLTNSRYARFIHSTKFGQANETVPGNVWRTNILNSSSTGLRNGGLITATAGTTVFNVAAGTGVIVDNTTDPDNPVLQEVIWGDYIGLTFSYLSTQIATFIGIDASGDVIQLPYSTYPSEAQRRSMIILGAISHTNKTSISYVFNDPLFYISPTNQLEDFTSAVGPFSTQGNFVTPIAGTRYLNKTAGESFMYGANYHYDKTTPSKLITPLISGTSTPLYPIIYCTGTEIIGASGYGIDTSHYDLNGGGTLSTALTNKYYTHRLWHNPINNLLIFQYAQNEYGNMADATTGLYSEAYVPGPSLAKWAYLLDIIIAKGQCTNLAVAADVKFLPQGKFAGTGGGGGLIGEAGTSGTSGTSGTTPTGSSGTFSSVDGKVITVTNGIITGIV